VDFVYIAQDKVSGNELSGSIKDEESHDQLSDYQLLYNDSAAWSQLVNALGYFLGL
jgi:hypothetical protein